jgi:hypothetical protein
MARNPTCLVPTHRVEILDDAAGLLARVAQAGQLADDEAILGAGLVEIPLALDQSLDGGFEVGIYDAGPSSFCRGSSCGRLPCLRFLPMMMEVGCGISSSEVDQQ